jgi:hypothetical protein
MKDITKDQIKKIKTLQGKCPWLRERDVYEGFLSSTLGRRVASCTELNLDEARRVIDELESAVEQAGKVAVATTPRAASISPIGRIRPIQTEQSPAAQSTRPRRGVLLSAPLATPEQVWKIKQMAESLPGRRSSAEALLAGLIRRIGGPLASPKPELLRLWQAGKVIEALKSMAARQSA